ncbi:uncharacterized protein LOC142639598 [Castanea sativa]|uniref:uncharacterized protein LOC142639598 n=1 Tax=Castanea sativa TaxID=21020 RepID=UPI003F65313C
MNLARRRIILDNVCQGCKRSPESVVHSIWECCVAQDVWAGSFISLQKCSNDQHYIIQLFEDLLERLSTGKFELFLVQAWIIWNQRNTVVHGGQLKDLRWLNKRAMDYLDEYKKSQDHLSILVTAPSRDFWQPPPPSVYKLNFDAAIFSSLKCWLWCNNLQ